MSRQKNSTTTTYTRKELRARVTHGTPKCVFFCLRLKLGVRPMGAIEPYRWLAAAMQFVLLAGNQYQQPTHLAYKNKSLSADADTHSLSFVRLDN